MTIKLYKNWKREIRCNRWKSFDSYDLSLVKAVTRGKRMNETFLLELQVEHPEQTKT